MNQVRANEQKIAGALARLTARKDYAVQMAMEKAMKSAVLFAMEIHEADGEHTRHLGHDEHYGWILLHNGNIVSKSLFKSDIEPYGWVSDILDRMADDLPGADWEGIVVAGMGTGYSERFERYDVMRLLVPEAQAQLPVYFVQYLKRAR